MLIDCRLSIAFCFAAALAIAAPAQAQPASEAARAAIGQWEFSNADRDRTCLLTLRGTPAAGGPAGAMALEWERKCAEQFPFSRDVSAWSVGTRDAIQLLDRAGRPAVELTEVEGSLYEGNRPGEGLVFMQSIAARNAEKTAEQMAGDWAFVRGSAKPLCLLALENAPAGTEALTIRIKAGCDPAIAKAALTSWRMDRGQLVLTPKAGEPWRFEESDATTWRRIPEGRQPIQLVKQ